MKYTKKKNKNKLKMFVCLIINFYQNTYEYTRFATTPTIQNICDLELPPYKKDCENDTC